MTLNAHFFDTTSAKEAFLLLKSVLVEQQMVIVKNTVVIKYKGDLDFSSQKIEYNRISQILSDSDYHFNLVASN